MDWRVQVIKAGVLNRLPFEAHLRQVKRRLVGYSPDEANLRQTAEDYAHMAQAVASVGRGFDGAAVLEIGSGWFPTIPLLLARDGARRVFLTDLARNMDERTFGVALDFVARHRAWPGVAGRRFEDFPFTYLAPFAPAQVRDRSLEFIASRTVLEHVPRRDLVALLRSLAAKLTGAGLMVHLVDHSDHLAHADPRLSMVNFLTWSARTHRFVTWLARGGENRLRHHEYPEVFRAAGLDVVASHAHVHEPTRRRLPTLRLAPPYDRMDPDALAIIRSIYVLRAA